MTYQKAQISIDGIDAKFPICYLDHHTRWNGWSLPYLPVEDIVEFVKLWNEEGCLKEGDEWSFKIHYSSDSLLSIATKQIVGLEYVDPTWEGEPYIAEILTLHPTNKIFVVDISNGLIWEHKLITKKYNAEGERMTDCCGTYSSYYDIDLCCKKCKFYVGIGEGDGTEFKTDDSTPKALKA